MGSVASVTDKRQVSSVVFERGCIVLGVGLILLRLGMSLYWLKDGWDDGAITAAFSRTWAETGRIALTPVSMQVEGYSSQLWFLLLSIPALFTSRPEAVLVWMKVLSGIFALLSVRLIYMVALRQFGYRSAASACALLLGLSTTTHYEIANGMEMNLEAFLLLALFHAMTSQRSRRRFIAAAAVSLLLLMTRFEVPFAFLLLFCGFLFANYRQRESSVTLRELMFLAMTVVVLFGGTEVWRHHVFGTWMPNTVYAKRFSPYRDWSTPAKFLRSRLSAIEEPLRIFGLPLLITAGVIVWSAVKNRTARASKVRGLVDSVHPAIFALGLGCFLFGALFGRNWGYPGRMTAGMMPFLILAAVGSCVALVAQPRLLNGLSAVMIGAQALHLALNVAAPFRIVSMRDVEPLGLGAEAIRRDLHQDSLRIMMSDVGSSTLCCERLMVIDSGLLTDPTLARTGWSDFATYFRKMRPDVVETHKEWAIDSRLYDGGQLNNYSLVASDGIRYFVRDDLYASLLAAHPGAVVPVESEPACLTKHENDANFSRSKGTCLVLNDSGSQRNLL